MGEKRTKKIVSFVSRARELPKEAQDVVFRQPVEVDARGKKPAEVYKAALQKIAEKTNSDEKEIQIKKIEDAELKAEEEEL